MNQDKCPIILVTGASGFLGNAVVSQLRCVDCDLRTTGRRVLPPMTLPKYMAADLSKSSAVSRLVAGVDIVIHVAGLAHQHRANSLQNDEFFRINTDATESVARAAASAGCRRFVLISSVSVYGNGWPVKKESDICQPLAPYAQSKLAAEQVASEIAAATGMELVILRMATLYGDNDPGNVGRLLGAIDRRRFVWIGSGTNRKSLVHVDDAASACVSAAICQLPLKCCTYNVSDVPCTMDAVVSTLAAALGRRAPLLRVPSNLMLTGATLVGKVPGLSGRAKRIRTTIDKWLSNEVYDAVSFRDDFGWTPKVSIQDGLTRQVECHRKRDQRPLAMGPQDLVSERNSNRAA